MKHIIPDIISKGVMCQCGAYGQTDLKSDAYMFAMEAAQALDIDGYRADELLEIRDGGEVFRFEDEPVIIHWGKEK